METYNIKKLTKYERRVVDGLLYPARRVGISRDFGWVSLICFSCIESNFRREEPKRSNNPFLLKDDIDWLGNVVEVDAPVNLFGKLVVRKFRYRKYYSVDDNFNDFIDKAIENYGGDVLRISKSSLYFLSFLVGAGYYNHILNLRAKEMGYKDFNSVSNRMNKTIIGYLLGKFKNRYIFPIKNYLIENNWIKKEYLKVCPR